MFIDLVRRGLLIAYIPVNIQSEEIESFDKSEDAVILINTFKK